jgi:hypothetical protein
MATIAHIVPIRAPRNAILWSAVWPWPISKIRQTTAV